jgi:hypothetical protein
LLLGTRSSEEEDWEDPGRIRLGHYSFLLGLVRPPAGAATSRRSHLSVAMHPPYALKERRISSFVDPLHATSDAHAKKPTNNRWRCALQREGARKRDPKPHLGPFVGGSHFTRMHGCGVMFNLKQTTALGGAHRHLIQTLGPASCRPNHSPQPRCMLSENDPNLLELYIRANAPRSLSF